MNKQDDNYDKESLHSIKQNRSLHKLRHSKTF